MVLKSETKSFYKDLNEGKVKRGILGIEQRFNVKKTLEKKNIYKYFVEEIENIIDDNSVVLDLGCGTGAFSISIADKCKKIYAIDIVEDFVIATKKNITEYKKKNITTMFQNDEKIPVQDSYFDVVLLVDVLHHVENIDEILVEIKRVLKEEGSIIIFEPNKLNPLMFLMHLFDHNERGLLKLGRPGIYRRRLKNFFEIEKIKFSGLVIGPEHRIFDLIVNVLNFKIINIFFSWLLPKILIIGKKCG
jgi:ubiquinone/menaquinone biosynthesis C-methylase UbiE